MPALKLVGAVLFVALGAFFADGDPVRLGIGVLAAVGLLGWAARDLLAPVRLCADADGITVVSGYAGRRRIPWTEIERITVDTRPRLGLRTETLEIDTGSSLHLLGRYDLDAPPAEVAEALHAVRPATPAD
ncbi:PH domain-containing protein [Plantactinospora sp. CA-290183]|uniref:PH domain-containing protein n=1 Tax=Plantactinospora sp. CA-290183 TaxID=3240006 RepID=UPI003D8C46B7